MILAQGAGRRMTMLLFAFVVLPAQALDIRFERVAEDVYAYIGDKGPHSVDNEGLNANIGLVVTPAGAVLIDSGATFEGARKIDEAIRTLTAQRVRWVINTGGQDHRWLGNGYFKAQGAELIAHARAAADMQSRGGDQLGALNATLGARVDGTIPTLPVRLIDQPDAELTLGGTLFQLRHRGGAHTPGDMIVWLPQKSVLFAGDVVYVDRLLGVVPVSNTKAWLATFAQIERLAPQRVVPGHGSITDIGAARVQTRDYLRALRTHMRKAIDDGVEIGAAVDGFDGKPYLHLLNAQELLRANANRVYLEMEAE